MAHTPNPLPSFEQAKLHAERLRIYSIIVLGAAFTLIALFRLIFPIEEGRRSLEGGMFAFSIAFLLFEAGALALINRAARAGRVPTRRLGIVHATLECLYPVVVCLVIMIENPNMRFTLLVSPAYAFMLLLVGISVLRVEPLTTIFVGLFTTAGYGELVACAFLALPSNVPGPNPPAMYVNLGLMLVLATVVAMFMSRQVREYVLAAVREVETRRQRDHLLRDLETASEIQKGLLPKAAARLRDYDVAAASQPADQTGGDYFDWQKIGADRLVISLGDVTGHGIGPALVTAACRAYVRAVLADDHEAGAALRRVNRLLYHDVSAGGRFVTLAMLDVTAEAHEVFLISAGHGPTVHVHADDGSLTELGSQGLPLGVMEDQTIDEAVRIRLEPGDCVVLFSDGFVEQHNASGEMFGMGRLREVLHRHRQSSPSTILAAMEEAVKTFAEGVAQEDDRTAVVVKRLNRATEGSAT